MAADVFWKSHLSFAEVARQLGGTRQNWKQRADRGSCAWDEDETGKRGVPMWFVQETLEMRNRDNAKKADEVFPEEAV